MSTEDRLEIANKFIKAIASHGRRFFYNKKDDFTGHFIMKGWRIYFVDDYTKREIYLHDPYWNRGFTNGGTCRAIVNSLKEYIQGRQDLPLGHLGPWPQWVNHGDLWGYGAEEMDKVRAECSNLVPDLMGRRRA